MNLSILADTNIPGVEACFGSLGKVQYVDGRSIHNEQLQGVDVLLVRSVTTVDAALLEGSGVRFVGTATSGIDHIDRNYLAQRGIAFAHAPGANANSVVEYVLAAIAAVGDKLEQLLAGGCVGIVGYGHIGRALAARLRALQIDCCVYDPWLQESEHGDLEQVLACDVVSLHPALTRRQPWPSFHLLGAAQLQRLGSETLLINASRGPVVDNAALLAVLEAGQGPRTVLDVWEGEPQVHCALLQKVALGTAHIAGYSLDGKQLATRMLCEALTAELQLPLPAPVDPVTDTYYLQLPPDTTGAALARHLLGCRYDIRCDDRLLRDAISSEDPGASAAAFDTLRKTYAERRELLGAPVRGAVVCAQDRVLVEGLGCVFDADGADG